MTAKKFRHIYRVLLTTALILTALGVMGACAAICLSGSFTPEKVAAALRLLVIPVVITGFLLLGGCLLKDSSPHTAPGVTPTRARPIPCLTWLRLGFGLMMLGLTVYGLLSGGTADVLAKAANICAECIGYG